MDKYLLSIKSLLPTGKAYDCKAVITLSAPSVDGATLISHVPPTTVWLKDGAATVPLVDNASLGQGSYYTLRLYSVETHGTSVTDVPVGTYVFVMPARDCDITEIITVAPTRPEPIEAAKAYASEAKEYASEAKESEQASKETLDAVEEYANTTKNTYDAFIIKEEQAIIDVDNAKNSAITAVDSAQLASLETIDAASKTAITEFTAVTEAANTKIADVVTDAETAAADAVAAKTAAETAKTNAETAKTDAETAADLASESASLAATYAIVVFDGTQDEWDALTNDEQLMYNTAYILEDE